MSERTCSVDSCDKPPRSRGWCGEHYDRWRRIGTPVLPPKPTVCSINGCDRPPHIRGWCGPHYGRWQRHGDPLAGGPLRGVPVEEWFWLNVNKTETCWFWTGDQDTCGYGRTSRYVRIPNSPQSRSAHRIAWFLTYNFWPKHELDHLCRVRNCVRPDHLDDVPHEVNVMRGAGFGPANAAKTHCPQGHSYSGDNLIRWKNARICRACRSGRTKQVRA